MGNGNKNGRASKTMLAWTSQEGNFSFLLNIVLGMHAHDRIINICKCNDRNEKSPQGTIAT